MKRSSTRILATHVVGPVRPQEVIDIRASEPDGVSSGAGLPPGVH